MKLFIVEDDKIQSLILEKMTKVLGLKHIGTEDSGQLAVTRILKNKPDIVLLDVNLNDSVSGIEVAKQIKEVYDPIIIYITGNSDFMHKSLAKKHGFHDYIVKPISVQKLKNSLGAIQLA